MTSTPEALEHIRSGSLAVKELQALQADLGDPVHKLVAIRSLGEHERLAAAIKTALRQHGKTEAVLAAERKRQEQKQLEFFHATTCPDCGTELRIRMSQYYREGFDTLAEAEARFTELTV